MSKILADYLTEEEAARELGRTPRTLQNWRAQRIGPAYTRFGDSGQVFYRRVALSDWLLAQEVLPVRARRRRSESRPSTA